MPSGRAQPGEQLLGAHLSIAGGVHQALLRAVALRCRAVQLFVHSNVQWRLAPLDPQEVRRFHEINARYGPFALAAHANYLVNLASPDRTLRERSLRVMVAATRRCAALGIPLLVMHPGAHRHAGERAGLRRVITGLNRIHGATRGSGVRTALEVTAGQGTGLGHRFDQIARILDGLREPERGCVCFDTAHAFAAGYDFRTRSDYDALWRTFHRQIGLRRLAIFHLNDSARSLGSRIDRHAHIGRGAIGTAPFGWILTDRRFRDLPKVIETPKEAGMDRKNLALLRRLARRGTALLLAGMVGLSALCASGCSRDDRWWRRVTGHPAERLGFVDHWEATVPGASGGRVIASVASGERARLDFSPEAGGYSVVYNHGRLARVRPLPPQEMIVDRTLLLTYLLPFMGRARLGEALTALGVDTNQVAEDVVWEGQRCICVGGGAELPGEGPSKPAIYFAAETGAVLRLVTIANSPLGRRVGDFRLFDHGLRAGVHLPARLETWGPQGLRSTLQRVEQRDGEELPDALFTLPPPPEGMP